MWKGSIFSRRYVFFSSLFNTEYHGNEYYKYGANVELGNNAVTHFSRHLTYNTYNVEDSDYVTDFEETIKIFYQQIKKWAENETNAEKRYIQQMHSLIKKLLGDENLPQEQKEELTTVLSYFPKEDDPQWNYPQLIAALTGLRTNAEKIKTSQKKLNDFLLNQRELTNNSDLLEKTFEVETDYAGTKQIVSKTLEELEATNYKEYREKSLDEGYRPLKNSIAAQVNDRADKAYRKILSTASQGSNGLYNQLQALFSSQQTSKDFCSQLRDWIYKKASDKEYRNYTSLIADIRKHVADEDTSWAVADLPPTSQFLEKLSPSLERAVLIGSNQIMTILNHFFDTTSNQFNAKFQEKYGPAVSKTMAKLMQKLQNATEPKEIKKIKNIMYKTIREELKHKYLTNINETYDSIRKKYRSFKKSSDKEQYIDMILKQSGIEPLYDKALKSITVTSLKDYNVAELEQDARNTFIPVLYDALKAKGRVYGKPIELKNDATISINFSGIDPSQISIAQDLKDNLASKTSALMDNFMTTYDKAGRKKTNLPISANVLKSKLAELGLLYKQAQNQLQDDQEQQKILRDFINNQAYEQISVKEYKFYNEGIGFKGGSLGEDYNAVEAIEQIQKLYNTGGINQLDTNLLIEAVLNSSPNTILGEKSDVLTNAKNYLLGGAIMAMFDAGYINTQKWLKLREKLLTPEGGPAFVNLYVFEGRYVPASLLLNSIADQLFNLYVREIEDDVRNVKVSSSIVIHNYISNEDIPNNPDAMYRWQTVSQTAQKNTKLYVMLAAGLLDIFEDLEKIFTNPQT